MKPTLIVSQWVVAVPRQRVTDKRPAWEQACIVDNLPYQLSLQPKTEPGTAVVD